MKGDCTVGGGIVSSGGSRVVCGGVVDGDALAAGGGERDAEDELAISCVAFCESWVGDCEEGFSPVVC